MNTGANQKGFSTLLLIFFLILAFINLLPYACLAIASFKPGADLLKSGLNLSINPDVMTLNNYKNLFSNSGISYLVWYKNSLVLTLLFTVFSLFLSSMVGYGLAIYDFKGRNVIFTLVMLVMMVPVEILMLPLYKLMISIQLINTYWGVIAPFVVSPFAIFFICQYVKGLPRDFLDAARIDGCSEFGIFFRIMLPLMKPALGAMAILQAMRSWNDFLWPLVVLRTDDMFTLPIGLASLITPYGTNYDILIAGSVLTVLPLIVLFIFFQRYFVSGLTIGGVKG